MNSNSNQLIQLIQHELNQPPITTCKKSSNKDKSDKSNKNKSDKSNKNKSDKSKKDNFNICTGVYSLVSKVCRSINLLLLTC